MITAKKALPSGTGMEFITEHRLDFALRIRNILIASLHFLSYTIHHWVRGIESCDGGVLVYFCLQCGRFLPCVF